MDLLTKMMAVFIDNGGELNAITDKFMMKFDNKILDNVNKKSAE